jgi:hypothetical protein
MIVPGGGLSPDAQEAQEDEELFTGSQCACRLLLLHPNLERSCTVSRRVFF